MAFEELGTIDKPVLRAVEIEPRPKRLRSFYYYCSRCDLTLLLDIEEGAEFTQEDVAKVLGEYPHLVLKQTEYILVLDRDRAACRDSLFGESFAGRGHWLQDVRAIILTAGHGMGKWLTRWMLHHELGHVIDLNAGAIDILRQRYGIPPSGCFSDSKAWTTAMREGKAITGHAARNPMEDFAESWACYMRNAGTKRLLETTSKRRFKLVNDLAQALLAAKTC